MCIYGYYIRVFTELFEIRIFVVMHVTKGLLLGGDTDYKIE
jgi:hypothetical protein